LKLEMAGSQQCTMLELQDLACHVVSGTGNQTLRIDSVNCRIDPGTGVLRMQAASADATAGITRRHAQSPRAAAFVLADGEVTLPRLRPERPFGGAIHFNWKDLALDGLPSALLARLPFTKMGGTTSGELTLHPQPDLCMDF